MARIQTIVACSIVAGSVVLAPASAVAQAQLGPYFAFGGGLDQVPDRDLSSSGRIVSSQWKPGWGAFAAVGYKWFFGLRTEAEFSGRASWIRTFNNAGPWAGTMWDDSGMFNALFDFEMGGPITPFIGAGLGLTQIQWGNNFRVSTQAAPTIYDAESIRLGWQGIAGFSFSVTPKLTLAVDYRFKGTAGDFGFPGSVAGKFINQFNYETHSLFLSVRYAFGI